MLPIRAYCGLPAALRGSRSVFSQCFGAARLRVDGTT